MTTLATMVDAALREAGVPIEGVSIGRADERATWDVQYAAGATAADKAKARGMVAAFDVSAALEAAAAAEAAQRIDSDPALKALLIAGLSGRLGRAPSDAEVTEERGRFVNAYRQASSAGQTPRAAGGKTRE